MVASQCCIGGPLTCSTGAGVHFMVCSGFREYEVKKIVFFFLQQAGEGNFFTSYSQNPERTIKSTLVPFFLHTLAKRMK